MEIEAISRKKLEAQVRGVERRREAAGREMKHLVGGVVQENGRSQQL